MATLSAIKLQKAVQAALDSRKLTKHLRIDTNWNYLRDAEHAPEPEPVMLFYYNPNIPGEGLAFQILVFETYYLIFIEQDDFLYSYQDESEAEVADAIARLASALLSGQIRAWLTTRESGAPVVQETILVEDMGFLPLAVKVLSKKYPKEAELLVLQNNLVAPRRLAIPIEAFARDKLYPVRDKQAEASTYLPIPSEAGQGRLLDRLRFGWKHGGAKFELWFLIIFGGSWFASNIVLKGGGITSWATLAFTHDEPALLIPFAFVFAYIFRIAIALDYGDKYRRTMALIYQALFVASFISLSRYINFDYDGEYGTGLSSLLGDLGELYFYLFAITLLCRDALLVLAPLARLLGKSKDSTATSGTITMTNFYPRLFSGRLRQDQQEVDKDLWLSGSRMRTVAYYYLPLGDGGRYVQGYLYSGSHELYWRASYRDISIVFPVDQPALLRYRASIADAPALHPSNAARFTAIELTRGDRSFVFCIPLADKNFLNYVMGQFLSTPPPKDTKSVVRPRKSPVSPT